MLNRQLNKAGHVMYMALAIIFVELVMFIEMGAIQ